MFSNVQEYTVTKWTRFYDMCSGGDQKEPFNLIYIEAAEEEAERIFTNRFGHDPQNVTCECCGRDYSVWEFDSLEEAQRGDGDGVSQCVIWFDEIKPEERADPWAR